MDSLGVSIDREDRWERFRHARMDAFRCGTWMQDRNAFARFFSGGGPPRRGERTPTQPKFAAALLYPVFRFSRFSSQSKTVKIGLAKVFVA